MQQIEAVLQYIQRGTAHRLGLEINLDDRSTTQVQFIAVSLDVSHFFCACVFLVKLWL